MKFEVKNATESIIKWIKDWFNDKPKHVVIGMSGGKDSTIVAALLCKAIGAENVFGVALPQGNQSVNGAEEICNYLGMNFAIVNIGTACESVVQSIHDVCDISKNTILNIPARIRMTTLYGLAQSWPGGALVVNTCNLSEDVIGYFTLFGDGAGDFAPLADYTVTEILEIGDYLKLPYAWVHKTPDDGLPHSSPDEKKLGFTYADLDKIIRGQAMLDSDTELKIYTWHQKNIFKKPLLNIPYPKSGLPCTFGF